MIINSFFAANPHTLRCSFFYLNLAIQRVFYLGINAYINLILLLNNAKTCVDLKTRSFTRNFQKYEKKAQPNQSLQSSTQNQTFTSVQPRNQSYFTGEEVKNKSKEQKQETLSSKRERKKKNPLAQSPALSGTHYLSPFPLSVCSGRSIFYQSTLKLEW